MKPRIRILALLLPAGLAACSKPADVMALTERTVTTLGPEGGMASSATGDMRLRFEANALSAPTPISITTLRESKDPRLEGPVYELQPHGLSFSGRVTIEADVAGNDALEWVWITESELVPLPSGHAADTSRISAELAHFSRYGLRRQHAQYDAGIDDGGPRRWDAGPLPDGSLPDWGPRDDGGSGPWDAGPPPDVGLLDWGPLDDGGSGPWDTGPPPDGGLLDWGPLDDGGSGPWDTGPPPDAGRLDWGPRDDGGSGPWDTGPPPDAGQLDWGPRDDGGSGPWDTGPPPDSGRLDWGPLDDGGSGPWDAGSSYDGGNRDAGRSDSGVRWDGGHPGWYDGGGNDLGPSDHGLLHCAQSVGQNPAPMIDVLLVVDNSRGMALEQQQLRDDLPVLIATLNGMGADFHIGVITTDMDAPTESGRLLGYPPYLDATTPNLLSRLAARLSLTNNGGSAVDESGLEAARVATSPALTRTSNARFLRPSSALWLIFASDEADQSTIFANSDVADYAQYFIDRAGLRRVQAVAITASVPPGSCSGALGAATSGGRYAGLAHATSGTSVDVCNADYAGAMGWVKSPEFGLIATFPLVDNPPTLNEVFVDGIPVDPSTYVHDAAAGTIEFLAGFVPPAGTSVELSYPCP